MSEWFTAISSVGFPIAACAGLGWFTYNFVKSIQYENRRREEDLMRIIGEQGDALRQIADVLGSISDRLEDVEIKISSK